MTPEHRHDLVVEAIRSSPSLAFVYVWVADLTINHVVGFAGLVFLALQFVGYLWRLRRDVRHERERRDAGRPPPSVLDQNPL